jgi:hypothetical protein
MWPWKRNKVSEGPPKSAPTGGLMETRTAAGDEAPESAIRDFGNWSYSCRPVPPPPGDYASWWKEPADAKFSESPTFAHMTRAFRALDGMESVVVASLAGLWLPDAPKADRIALPTNAVTVAAQRGGEAAFLVTMAKDKGIRFHFLQSTPRQDRERMWKLFADYAVRLRAMSDAMRAASDPRSDTSPRAWWDAVALQVRDQEEGGGSYEAFGIVMIAAE